MSSRFVPNPTRLESWGMNFRSEVPVFFPESIEEIQEIFKKAKLEKKKITLRGGGCSYGDASFTSNQWVINLSKFNRILEFDRQTGVIELESGATIKDIWEYALPKQFWPPVVSGTMYPTIGGAISMNIHGKNNFQVGTLGEHVLEFSILLVDGTVQVCSPKKNADLYFSAISGFGMFGIFLTVKLQLKRLYSGKMKVWPVNCQNLEELFTYYEKNLDSSDYLVGWIDGFATGKNLGRAAIHKAVHLQKGEDKDFPANCALEKQNLPTRFLGLIPKSWMWLFMLPFSNAIGMRFINMAKFYVGFLNNNKPYLQGHAEYAFLLDYVPNWKFMYKPGAMIQYQPFVPKQNAKQCFEELLQACQRHKLVSYLLVFKKHKPDPFYFTHSVDGYSLAMDFPVTKSNTKRLSALVAEMNAIVLKHDGKFYFAKDSMISSFEVSKFFSKETLKRFRDLKKKYDPGLVLETDLFLRVMKTLL